MMRHDARLNERAKYAQQNLRHHRKNKNDTVGNHVNERMCQIKKAQRSTEVYYTRRTPTTTLNDDMHDCLEKEQRLENDNRTKQILIPPNYSIQ